MTCSMSKKEDCFDNAVVESFFASLKREECDGAAYPARDIVRQRVFTYLEQFYTGEAETASSGSVSDVHVVQHGDLRPLAEPVAAPGAVRLIMGTGAVGLHGTHVAVTFLDVEAHEATLVLAQQVVAQVALFLAAVQDHRAHFLLDLRGMFWSGNDDGVHVHLRGLGAAAHALAAAGLS